MNRYQRAAQLWSVLMLAARHQRLVSYEIASGALGVAGDVLDECLALIESYCAEHELPSLGVIVVSEKTGLSASRPGCAAEALAAQNRVFVFDWFAYGAPSAEVFDKAFRDANG